MLQTFLRVAGQLWRRIYVRVSLFAVLNVITVAGAALLRRRTASPPPPPDTPDSSHGRAELGVLRQSGGRFLADNCGATAVLDLPQTCAGFLDAPEGPAPSSLYRVGAEARRWRRPLARTAAPDDAAGHGVALEGERR